MATETSVELETIHEGRISDASLQAVEGPFTRLSLDTFDPTADHARHPVQRLAPGRATIVMIQLAAINFVTSFCSGLIVVGLPTLAASLPLEESLLLWPSSAFFLTSGTCLLLAGTLADVIGARSVNLTGCFFVAVFALAQGFAQTGIQLIVFRAMQGIALALTFPSSVSIISTSVESGRRRNIGFASLGLAQPLGFSFGLVLGGLLVNGLGWRYGFYIAGSVSFLLFAVGIWALPAGVKSVHEISVWARLKSEVDWVGALVASTALALLSYVLA
jgi:MFS family permease